jgi:lysophospholipase L1-like esterase
MKTAPGFLTPVLTGSLLVLFVLAVQALPPAGDPDPARFADEIEEFARWDGKNAWPENGLLFVGSSSIRLWQTAGSFPGLPVINRGFGGAHISDVNYYFEQVIAPYRPSMIIFYAGDNDIAAGKPPARVAEDFRIFAERARTSLGQVKILFISIKPSIARWDHWPVMMEANRMIADYISREPDMQYVDLATPLLGRNGLPEDVYRADGLHLNEWGYRIWNDAIRPYLNPH